MPIDIGPTSEPPSGPFWSPPIPVDVGELSPVLLQQIDHSEDRLSYRAYVVQVFADRAGPPQAVFEIAFNRKNKRACAIFEAVAEADADEVSGGAVVATDPVWVIATSPRTAVDAAFQALVERCSD